MILNLKILVYSYLNLEDILRFLKLNPKLRDKLITKYFTDLPDIDQQCLDGNLETVKYLIQKKFEPSRSTIYDICRNGNLEILKIILDCYGLTSTMSEKPESRDWINIASTEGHLEVVKFFEKNGVKPSMKTMLNACEEEHIELTQYLYKSGLKITKDIVNTSGFDRFTKLRVLQFLKYLKIIEK